MPDLAAQSLQRQILQGSYKPGQMLPGQRVLAESLGISRASLREALSTLETLGFVRSIPGKGTLVVLGLGSGTATETGGGSSVDIRATFELRFAMEPIAAALAANVSDANTSPRLWSMQARFEAALNVRDLVSASYADLHFHQMVAELSGNAAFWQVMRNLETRIIHSLRLPFADHTRIHEPAVEHRAIAAAISAGDIHGAKQAMQAHLLQTASRAAVEFHPH